jgi:NADH:ubiquinone oxidoreductase subunit 5 (subunit L)/multisubunit Na+/H+ antiporter MnhA subunit
MLLPLAACLTLLVLGRRMGTPLAGYIATGVIAISVVCSGWGMLRWISGGNHHGEPFGLRTAPIDVTWKWIPIGTPTAPNGFEQDHPGWLDFSIYIDSLTIAMFVTVTLTAMLIHIFVVRSLRRDPKFVRFFTCLQFVCFATLAMLLSGTLLQMVLMLELVGFAASLLVGFRSDSQPLARTSGKMFVVCRVGDIGLILGTGILFSYAGNLSLPELWLMLGGAASGSTVLLPGGMIFPTTALTIAGVSLFLGAASRCAQFPLQVWANDVAEGVAPAAAMVFAVTVSLAGLVFVARLFPLLTPSARLLIAIVGTTTLIMGVLIACVQSDIKKVLAFVAVSQLGFMVLGIGVGSWVGAMFHLVAYGFFQVLLFLAAGAVIRSARGETQLSQFGGLWSKMPVTAIASAVAVLAVCGVGSGGVGLSGYFSRGVILRHVGAFVALATGVHRSSTYWALFVLPVVGTMLTAFCMTRWWVLVFAGKPRDVRIHGHAREVSTLYWPLVILAIMSALAGNWLGVRDVFESSIFESRRAVQMQAQSSTYYHGAGVRAFDAIWPAGDLPDDEDRRDEAAASSATVSSAALARGSELFARWVWPCVLAGMLGGLVLYLPGERLSRRLVRIPPLNWIHAWLYDRMYFDDLYDSLIVAVLFALAHLTSVLDRTPKQVESATPATVDDAI